MMQERYHNINRSDTRISTVENAILFISKGSEFPVTRNARNIVYFMLQIIRTQEWQFN